MSPTFSSLILQNSKQILAQFRTLYYVRFNLCANLPQVLNSLDNYLYKIMGIWVVERPVVWHANKKNYLYQNSYKANLPKRYSHVPTYLDTFKNISDMELFRRWR